jgi:hypothetical protein
MKTTLLSALSIFAFAYQVSAQSNETIKKQACDKLIKETAYVFEGKLISSYNFKGVDGKNYVSSTLQIEEIVRGNLKKGTIEIITDQKSYKEDPPKEVSDSNRVTPPMAGQANDTTHFVFAGTALYFCSDAEANVNNSGKTNPKINTMPVRVLDVALFSGDQLKQYYKYGVFNYFTSLTDVCNYFKTNYNLTINKGPLDKKPKAKSNAKP